MATVATVFHGRLWRHACVGLLIGLTGCVSQAAAPRIVTTPIMIKGHLVHAELAITAPEQQQGLMNRTSLPTDQGMLFVFPVPKLQGFWMKDTRLPLSIAFIDANKRIVNIADMMPLDEMTIHRSASAVPYALEVNKGWFAAKGIVAGDSCEFTVPGVATR